MVAINQSILSFIGSGNSQKNSDNAALTPQTNKQITLGDVIAAPSTGQNADILDLSPDAIAFLQRIEVEQSSFNADQREAARNLLERFESRQPNQENLSQLQDGLAENNIALEPNVASNDNSPQESFNDLIEQLQGISRTNS